MCLSLIFVFIVFAFIIIVIIVIIITIVVIIIVVIIYGVVVVVVVCIVIVIVICIVIVIIVVNIHSCSGEVTIGQVGKVIVIIIVIQRDIIGIIWIIIGRIEVDNGAAILPGKGQVSRRIATSAKAVNMINVILGEWKFGPMVTDQSAPGGQAHEVVTALMVPSRVEGNGTSGTGVHGVVMFFMHLHVTPKLQLAVFVVIQIIPSHEHLGTQSVRDTVVCQKHVQPEDAGVDHLLQHQGRKAPERDRMIHTTRPFFDRPNKPFHFRNKLIIRINIEARAHTGKGCMKGLEFTIGMHHVDKQTTGPIYVHHVSQSLRNSHILLAV